MKNRSNDKGAVAPLVAVMLVLIILCVALVVDLGHQHNVRIELQRAVDAAALAGAGQIDGGASQTTRVTGAAQATAAANHIDNRAISVATDNIVVTLGKWDDTALGTPASTRFAPSGTPVNAVKVTASTEVNHYFYLFKQSSTVTADAIAVNEMQEQALPFVLVSCVQTDDTYLTPGDNICDIAYFKWGPDPTDTGGWTSLTYRPANKPNIEQFFTPVGNSLFNQVVYGTGLSHDGLEHENVLAGPTSFSAGDFDTNTNICAEKNVELNVVCGLGDSLDPAATKLAEPLGYGTTNALPRWFDNIHDPEEFVKQAESGRAKDHFVNVWSMNGILLPQAGENSAAFATRLDALKSASDSGNFTAYETSYGTMPFKDGRFSKFIGYKAGAAIPLYEEVLRYTGYPLVAVQNGVIDSALGTFIDEVSEAGTNHFKSALLDRNKPFDITGAGGVGQTLQLTIPVIFTGSCDSTKFLKGMPYIGVSDILITRIWKGSNDGYDAGADPLTFDGSAGTCSPPKYNPAAPNITSDGKFLFVKGKGAAMEGFIKPPTSSEAKETGIRKIYLVK